jgi:hypothetical protein
VAAARAEDPFAAMADEVDDAPDDDDDDDDDDEAKCDGDGQQQAKAEEWTSLKDRKAARGAHVEQLKKKLRGEGTAGGGSGGGGDGRSAEEAAAAAAALAAEEQESSTLLDEANALRAAEKNMDVSEIRKAREAAEEDRMRKDGKHAAKVHALGSGSG